MRMEHNRTVRCTIVQRKKGNFLITPLYVLTVLRTDGCTYMCRHEMTFGVSTLYNLIAIRMTTDAFTLYRSSMERE